MRSYPPSAASIMDIKRWIGSLDQLIQFLAATYCRTLILILFHHEVVAGNEIVRALEHALHSHTAENPERERERGSRAISSIHGCFSTILFVSSLFSFTSFTWSPSPSSAILILLFFPMVFPIFSLIISFFLFTTFLQMFWFLPLFPFALREKKRRDGVEGAVEDARCLFLSLFLSWWG